MVEDVGRSTRKYLDQLVLVLILLFLRSFGSRDREMA
jgi:hypothetical protein